jgi:hypothetical protein
MNKREIDEMMRHLPSQQPPPETLLQKAAIAIMFIVILVLMMWVPDFTLTEAECAKQDARANVSNLCQQGTKP